MKKVLILTVVCFFVLLGKGFAQDISDSRANNLLKLQKYSENIASGNGIISEQQDIDELLSRTRNAINDNLGVIISPAWFSSDPNDLAPLRGTKWDFTYTLTSTWTDTLTFGSAVQTTTDGYVGLSVVDQYGSQGAVFYMDLPQGGRGFGAITESSIINQYYFFTITGNTATGYYGLEEVSTGEMSDLYFMTGIKISGPTTTTTTTTTDNPVIIANHLVTKDPKRGTGCETPISVSNFSTQDEIAWSWMLLEDGVIGDVITKNFYGPDSELYTSIEKQIVYTSECNWGGIYIKGYPPENMPGVWEVDVFVDDIYQYTDTFTISQTLPTTTIAVTTTTTIPVTTTTIPVTTTTIPVTTTTIPVTTTTTIAVTTTTTSVPANNTPNMPSNPYPSHGATDAPSSVMLSWDGGDPDNGDNVTYDIYLGIGAEVGFYRTTTTGRCEANNLEPSTSYKWKVVAMDNHGGIIEGPIWTFTTEKASSGCAAEKVLGDDIESLTLLRQFRDDVLSKSATGKALIKLYYERSPQIVELIEKNPALKEQWGTTLKAVIPVIRKVVNKTSALRD